MHDKPFTVVEFADFAACCTTLAYKLLNEKKIRAYRVGAHWRIPREAAEDFVRGSGGEQSKSSDRTAA